VAAFIESAPLRRITLEPSAVGYKAVKAEFADSQLEAFADLAAHLSESGPAQIVLRQRPLEKGGAIAIVHCRLSPLATRAFAHRPPRTGWFGYRYRVRRRECFLQPFVKRLLQTTIRASPACALTLRLACFGGFPHILTSFQRSRLFWVDVLHSLMRV
jgi:hypothetical protein